MHKFRSKFVNKYLNDIFIIVLQIERELVLSSDKASSKIPLMHEARTPSGARRSAGIPLLQRQTGAIAPDHPPKQMQAWVRGVFYLYVQRTHANAERCADADKLFIIYTILIIMCKIQDTRIIPQKDKWH